MASEGVVDLLELHLERRSESLRVRWPQPLDASLTGKDGETWTVEGKAAIDIAVLIIRAINAHCDPLDPVLGLDESTMEARRKTEEKIHLLRYSWYTTPYSPPSKVTEEVLKIQRHVCRKVLRGKTKITFERLIESSVLAEAFWSRPEFLAWSLSEHVCEEGAEEWTKQKITCIPIGKDQSATEESAVREELAKKSLIKWKWDGETQLADFVATRFKLEWSTADGNHHQGIRAWPCCLRVRFDPGERDDAPRFGDLARVTLNGPIQQDVAAYRLLATVKLGGAGRDFIRVYDSDVRDARPMAARAWDLPHVNINWRLGQPGFRYMLYYILCDPEAEPDFDPEESTLVPWRQVELVNHLKSTRDSIEAGLQEPVPYGYVTVTEPEENQDPRALTLQRVKEQGGNLELLYGPSNRL